MPWFCSFLNELFQLIIMGKKDWSSGCLLRLSITSFRIQYHHVLMRLKYNCYSSAGDVVNILIQMSASVWYETDWSWTLTRQSWLLFILGYSEYSSVVFWWSAIFTEIAGLGLGSSRIMTATDGQMEAVGRTAFTHLLMAPTATSIWNERISPQSFTSLSLIIWSTAMCYM